MNEITDARLRKVRNRRVGGLFGWQGLIGAVIGAAIGLLGVAFATHKQDQVTREQQTNTRRALAAEISLILEQAIGNRNGSDSGQGSFVCHNFTHSRIFNGLGEKLTVLTPDQVAKVYPAYLNEKMMSDVCDGSAQLPFPNGIEGLVDVRSSQFPVVKPRIKDTIDSSCVAIISLIETVPSGCP